MPNELIINITADETRIAYLENGVLSELHIERGEQSNIVGNIYKGRVQRVLPGMNAAFVEIGLDKAGFLYANDFSQELKDVAEDDEDEIPPAQPAVIIPEELVQPSPYSPELLEALSSEEENLDLSDFPSSSEETQNEEADLNLVKVPEEITPEDCEINLSEDSNLTESNPNSEQKSHFKKIQKKYKWAGRDGIQKHLKAGEEILVQVSRDHISTKGARITSHISLPGRFLVFMPTWNRLGVSKKISSFEERRRLRQILREQRPNYGGFIVRTAAEGIDPEKLIQDMKYLVHVWEEVGKKKNIVSAPALLQTDLKASLKIFRDLYAHHIDKVWVDDASEYESIKNFLEKFMPELLPSLKNYADPDPIFDRFGIEGEINRAFGKKIWLKSGGYLIIEQTEALCTIDVNTGRFTGKKNLEETILKNNLEAIKEIAYQIKLRNLGGIIILDLIDMEKRSNREIVYQALVEAFKNDRARTSITKISEIGLIEMTRKRSKESLTRLLGEACPTCAGKGYIKSPSTLVYDILREIKREAGLGGERKIVVEVSKTIHQEFLQNFKSHLEIIEKNLKRKIELKLQEKWSFEQYQVH